MFPSVDLWSPDQRGLAKRKVPSRVCSCSWTNDGQYFALGLFNGIVTIWSKVSTCCTCITYSIKSCEK